MRGFLMLLYGVANYVVFFTTFLFLVGFVGDLPLLPKTIDSGLPGPWGQAIVVDLLLIALFGVQHSVMARPAFKRWWTGVVPEPMERSTYVLAATLMLALILWQWRSIASPIIWNVESAVGAIALQVVFWAGWGVLLLSTFLLNHFELFGLRQVLARMLGHTLPVAQFRTPLLYRHVRHPIYLGFLLAFWATPLMTAGHLLFALGMTAYVLVGIYFEERDLVALFGDRYRRYREQVGMLLPWRRKARRLSPVSD